MNYYAFDNTKAKYKWCQEKLLDRKVNKWNKVKIIFEMF